MIQVINLFIHNKTISADYLGNFSLALTNYGDIKYDGGSQQIYIDYMKVIPTVVVDSRWHPYFVLIFSLIVWGIVLYYNYQLMQLFTKLNQSVNQGSPFNEGLSECFVKLARFSAIIFICGTSLSFIKILLLSNIQINGLIFKPCFDQGILNFAWLSVGFFIISAVFRIGLQLKTEQELTI